MIITETPREILEIKFEDDRFALVHRIYDAEGSASKVIILNQREALQIHQFISNAILGEK